MLLYLKCYSNTYTLYRPTIHSLVMKSVVFENKYNTRFNTFQDISSVAGEFKQRTIVHDTNYTVHVLLLWVGVVSQKRNCK